MDRQADQGAANRGARPGPAGGDVTGSGAGAGGGGSPEDFDSDLQAGDRSGSPKTEEAIARKKEDVNDPVRRKSDAGSALGIR